MEQLFPLSDSSLFFSKIPESAFCSLCKNAHCISQSTQKYGSFFSSHARTVIHCHHLLFAEIWGVPVQHLWALTATWASSWIHPLQSYSKLVLPVPVYTPGNNTALAQHLSVSVRKHQEIGEKEWQSYNPPPWGRTENWLASTVTASESGQRLQENYSRGGGGEIRTKESFDSQIMSIITSKWAHFCLAMNGQ